MTQHIKSDGEHTETIGPFEMCTTGNLMTTNAIMIQTCVGTFYYGQEIGNFTDFVNDIKRWDFNGGVDYDFMPLLFQPTDKKLYKFLSQIIWDEIQCSAVFHLPYRYNHMFDDLDLHSEWNIIQRLLILSGDVELNPGPTLSRPLQYRNNDPRTVRLEKALEKKEQKIRKLLKDLRLAIKENKIYAQGFLDDLRNSPRSIKESAGELNGSLNRICDFLEASLPTIQQSLQSTILESSDKLTTIKDDLILLVIICILIRLLMIWKHYKTALTVVLLFVLKFYGFDESIINLVHELRTKFATAQSFEQKAEDLIYHPYFHTCGKLIFAVMVFVCIKKIPGKQDWDNYISRLDRIPKALNGSQKIIDFCSEYFNVANDQLKMMVLGKTREELSRANGLYGEIYEWAAEVRKYLDLEQRNKIDTDITIANRVEDLYKRGVQYQQDTLLDKEIARLVAVTLLPARELYQYVSCSPVKGGGPRMRPICVWLSGESGVGKTEMIYPLCIDVLRTMGLMNKQDFHNQVYARQVETEFWDGYKQQKIVIYDDAFQMKDDKTTPNPEIFEVIRACNTFPQHLHMAALHDKNTFSSAELMLYTTNDANVQIESITFPDAFFNRIGEHAYRVRPKTEFSIETPRGNSGETYRRLDKSKLDKDVPIDLKIYEFQKIVRDDLNNKVWTEVGDPIDYDTFAKLICDEWKQKKTDSIRKLKFLENYAIRAQNIPEDEFYDACEYDHTWFVNDITRRYCNGSTLVDIEAVYAEDEELFRHYLNFKSQRKISPLDKYKDRLDDCLSRVKSYLGKLKDEIVKIVREHPYLSVLGIVGLILSAFALYKWFTDVVEIDPNPLHSHKGTLIYDYDYQRYFTPEEAEQFDELIAAGKTYEEIDELMGDDVIHKRWERWRYGNVRAEIGASEKLTTSRFVEVGTSGDVRTTKPTQKRVEVGSSGDVKTSRNQQKRVEVGSSGDVKTSRSQQKRVEVGVSGDSTTTKSYIKKVESLDDKLLNKTVAQGCRDTSAHTLITDVLQKSTYRISYMRGTERKPFGNCTFVSSWTFVMPYHFLQALYARKLAPETMLLFSQSKYYDIIRVPLSHLIKIGIDDFTLTKNVVQLTHTNGEKRDCVLVNLHTQMCHPHRDLIKHFVKVEDQGKLQGNFHGTLATFHESGGELYRTYQWLQHIRPLDAPITICMQEGDRELNYVQRECYEYNAPTQVGDCGSIIGLYNHRMERKLIGMHIAGTNESYGYACPLTQECINDALTRLIGKDLKNISAQYYYEIPKGVDPSIEPSVPEGLFCPLGKSDKKVGQAVKTAIVPSSIHGKLSKPFMRPAILKPTMINGVLHDPLLQGLKKCGVETAVLPLDEVESAVQDVAQVVLTKYNTTLDKKQYQRILSYEEAVAGVESDSMMNGVARNTSPGFPYNLQAKGYPGKTKWMGRNEYYDFDSTPAKQLRSDVEQLLEDCRVGKISDVVFIDTLKDERREQVKVDAGKTRVFSAGPQHFVVAFRKYFLPFSAWLMHNRIDNEIAVGTNPYSVDWERITKRMKSKGGHVIAGDFGNFDGSLVAQVLWAIFWEIFVPWLRGFNDITTEEGMNNVKVCLGLWTHLVHSVHIFGDNVYMWTHSQPSGNPFTVIINCLYNSVIMRIAWIKIMKEDYPQWVSMKWFRKHVAMIAYGDDNILNISREAIEFYNQESISNIMKSMKHEYTDEAKSGQIVKSRRLEDIFFLKRGFRFCEELQRTVAPLKREVIYEMLNWSRNTIDPNVILMSNIETAFREIVYHGREEYDKLREGILRVSDDLPSMPQILTYEQYLWDVKYLADEVYDF
nr:MAG: hypothetical protein 1 [Cripavirus sp.]